MTQKSINYRETLIHEIKLRLGAINVTVELAPEQYDFAVTVSLDRYRMRSANAEEEAFIVFEFQPEQQVYTLPNEVQTVIDIYRQGLGSQNGGASSIDPFSLAFTNSVYMSMSPGGMGGGMAGTLINYELGMSYQKLIGRMFGGNVMFTFNPATKKLFIERRFLEMETVILHVFNTKPEVTLLTDPYAKVWIRDYATAVCKDIMGNARSKFQGIGGPQGQIQLNGEALKTEAKDEFARLEDEIKNGLDASTGYGWIVG